MTKMLTALATAAFALALAPAANAGFTIPSINAKSLVQKTCDGEDYADMLEARAEARAEALEDGGGYPSRQASVQQTRAPQRASAEPGQQTPPAEKPKATADASDKKDTKTETKSETKKADEPKKTEAKSIASADGSCKKYFSSVGMTLSVPCE